MAQESRVRLLGGYSHTILAYNTEELLIFPRKTSDG